MSWIFRTVCFLAAVLLSGSLAHAQNDSVAQHFKGKTINLIISTGSGGAYGGYGLVFAQHFGWHIHGEPVVVSEYRPGAGGIFAANYLHNVAPKDGTVIAIPLAPLVLAQHTGTAAGHLNCIDNPAAFNLAVGKFLDMNRRAL
jgi:tripartite-type tricarboxylate transporter receptor subunit TctC